jgi:hypothetical protein
MNVVVGIKRNVIVNAGAAGIRLTANDKQLGKQSGNQANKQAVRQTNKQSGIGLQLVF